MALLQIEGDTLGQKHCSYNKIVNETKQEKIAEINYDDSDLDNLLKIDIACKNRNVDFILKVFESEDMLYVSRAIKQSTWLITDPQYSHIINLKYLNEQLYTKMYCKGFNKLLLHVRLNLKDEVRAEEFFNYYKERDFKVARKWLPLCSVKFTENIIQKYAADIPKQLLKRLCEKASSYLEVYHKSYTSYYRRDALTSTMFLLKNDINIYLDIIEKCKSYDIPKFGPKQTKLIMTKCPERVMNKLEKYCQYLHPPTFAKFIKREDIKDFILKNIKNKDMRCWFSQSNIEPFIACMPKESRFDFVKDLFIDKKYEVIEDELLNDFCDNADDEATSQNIYCWYKYAPFNTAFEDLKKLIRAESNPTERTAMFNIILNCARSDLNNIHLLLEYYRENHINEPFKFKIQFVNVLLSRITTHKFCKETWGYLNDLLSSMEVYNESDKLDQNCVRSIILYNVIHNKEIPDIIQQKFIFESLKPYQKKLSEEEKEKVFLYLYKYLLSKIRDVKNEKECSENLDYLMNILNLLVDWNKELEDFPVILNKIKEIIRDVKRNKWNNDLMGLYDIKTSWRKLLFTESILISPTQETCINALKHGPELLKEYKNEVDAICLNDTPTIRFLKKIRIYWSQSLANTYKELFVSKFDQKKVHKAIIKGLCIILPRNEVLKLVKKYVPKEAKIDWREPNEVELSLRKHIAMNIHFVRPQPSPAAALLYAKGDYLQFALPSLNAILYNISCTKTRDHLSKLLNAPVSLQKHGIRLAFAKLKHDELTKIFSQIWESNKNSSIRANIFNQTVNFLCNAKDETVIKEIWELLSVFIENLTSQEDKLIYTNLSHAEKVPMSVRPEFWMKSYKFLRSMPPHLNCDGLLSNLRCYMCDVMEFLEDDFIAEVFLESFDESFSTDLYAYHELVATFLLSTKTEDAHIARYNKILVPILERSFEMWDVSHNGAYYVKFNLLEIFTFMDMKFKNIVLNKNMFLPIPMYGDALTKLRENLTVEENYVALSTRKLALDCVQIFDKVLKSNEKLKSLRESTELEDSPDWSELYMESAPDLGRVCCEYLKEDLEEYFPSIYMLLGEAFDDIFSNYGFSPFNKLQGLESFLSYEHLNEFYLFVLNLMSDHGNFEEANELRTALMKRISKHSSEEVHMLYCLKKKKLEKIY